MQVKVRAERVKTLRYGTINFKGPGMENGKYRRGGETERKQKRMKRVWRRKGKKIKLGAGIQCSQRGGHDVGYLLDQELK